MVGLIAPPATQTGILKYEWVDPLGIVHDMSNRPYRFVFRGSKGLGYVMHEMFEDKLPDAPGAIIRHISTPSRQIEIPVYIQDDSLGDLAIAIEELYSWFDTGDEASKTPGYFRVTRPDDTVRQLACYYVKGLEGDTNEGGVDWTKLNIQLVAPDPYPHNPTPFDTEYSVASAAGLGIMNDGKLPAYPIWKITGPFTNVNLYNESTDKNLGFLLTIAAGHYMIIDTRPSELRDGPSVYDDAGTNLMATVGIGDPTSVFWPLRPGSNTMVISFTSGTTTNTRVRLTFTERYRSLFR